MTGPIAGPAALLCWIWAVVLIGVYVWRGGDTRYRTASICVYLTGCALAAVAVL